MYLVYVAMSVFAFIVLKQLSWSFNYNLNVNNHRLSVWYGLNATFISYVASCQLPADIQFSHQRSLFTYIQLSYSDMKIEMEIVRVCTYGCNVYTYWVFSNACHEEAFHVNDMWKMHIEYHCWLFIIDFYCFSHRLLFCCLFCFMVFRIRAWSINLVMKCTAQIVWRTYLINKFITWHVTLYKGTLFIFFRLTHKTILMFYLICFAPSVKQSTSFMHNQKLVMFTFNHLYFA